MKKIFIMFLFICFINVHADKCTYDQKVELTKLANEIKVDYDEKSKDVHVIDEQYDFIAKDYWLEISIYNIPKDFILEISNDYNDDIIKLYDNSIKDGLYTFKDYDYYKIINYKVDIYNVSTCDKYLVKTITYKKPMYNPNYAYDICKKNEDIPFCNKYVLSNKKIFNMGIGLNEAVNNYKQTNEEKVEKVEKDVWIKKNYKYIIGGVMTVLFIVGVVLYINKRRGEL